jgi:phospholipid/cholesterol/gamma-HCH transport system substrate-binding protein
VRTVAGQAVLMAAPGVQHVRRFCATAIVAAAVVAVVGSCVPMRQSQGHSLRADYCAFMPDSVGLYEGNPVTQMGYRIGTVKAITEDTTHVRVDFTVTEQRRLPRDVKAIIRSTSVLADRSLELVGNPAPGPQLVGDDCIPLGQSFTPKSLSQVVNSATNFINSVSPDDSANIGDVVRGIDHAIKNNGVGINQLLTTSSSVLDSPDQAISDLGSIVNNLADLTTLLTELRGPLKQILLDAQQTSSDVVNVAIGSKSAFGAILYLILAGGDIEAHLGDSIQFTLDSTAMAVRKLSAHAPRIGNLLNPVPWWINSIAQIANNHQFNTLRYRPPLYRIRTPDGVAMCNIMNASAPGSCANVQGTPYAVDVALLQYVLQAASR